MTLVIIILALGLVGCVSSGQQSLPAFKASLIEYVDSGRTPHLVLAGPAVRSVADDPEGAEVAKFGRDTKDLFDPH